MNEISAALSRYQGMLQNPKLDKTNPQFKSGYVSLLGVLEATRAAKAECGLAFLHFPNFEEGKCVIDTLITHTSGEYIQRKCSFPIEKTTPQGMGSAITYAKRYAELSISGIVGEEDDDGNEAENGSKGKAKKAESAPLYTEDQKAAILIEFDELFRRAVAVKEAGKMPKLEAENHVSQWLKQQTSGKAGIEATVKHIELLKSILPAIVKKGA